MTNHVVRASEPKTSEESPWERFSRRSRGIVGIGGIEIDRDLSEGTMAEVYARRVLNNPHDARSHVQRLNHHAEEGEAAEAYGAAVDLFIALGATAAGLRGRMLEGVRVLIGTERTAALADKLTSGLDRNDPVPYAAWSVLTTGVTGTPVVRSLRRPAVSGHMMGVH